MSRPALKPCGTPAAYRRHLRNGEEACAACRKAHSDSIAPYKTREWRPRQLKPCGTEAAYQRHLRNGERPDFKCRLAHSNYVGEWAKASRARKRAAA